MPEQRKIQPGPALARKNIRKGAYFAVPQLNRFLKKERLVPAVITAVDRKKGTFRAVILSDFNESEFPIEWEKKFEYSIHETRKAMRTLTAKEARGWLDRREENGKKELKEAEENAEQLRRLLTRIQEKRKLYVSKPLFARRRGHLAMRTTKRPGV